LIARLGGEHIVEFALAADARHAEPSAFAGLPSVQSARTEGDGFALTVEAPHRAIPALLDYLEAERLPLARLTTRQVSLEDVFVSLTGRHLREDEPEPDAKNGAGKNRRRDRGFAARSRKGS
jgi:ABC-2 type transport system ATP-binding protein